MGDWKKRWAWIPTLAMVVACGGDDEPSGSSTDSGDGDNAIADVCAEDRDCSDGRFCNGDERCDPDDEDANDFGCVSAAEGPCSSDDNCNEQDESCGCAEPDADNDGSLSIECGGDDCDDNDSNRNPTKMEVCDDDHVDEDCDPNTFGYRDQDGDDDPDEECCNEDPENNELICGTDCDDNRGNAHSFNTEVCDDIDNDCDGLIDEAIDSEENDGLKTLFTEDADGDGWGSDKEDAKTILACEKPDGFAADANDCDDEEGEVNPAAVDSCNDEIDNDCSGAVNDPMGGCDCEGNETRSCALGGWLGKCATFDQQCNDGTWDDCPLTKGAETEICDGFNIDEDCDGLVDELNDDAVDDFGLRTSCYVDLDNDGFAASTTGVSLECSCGAQQTSTEPTNSTNTDCSDDPASDTNAASRAPDQNDVCGDGIDNDCDLTADNDPAFQTTYYADTDGDGLGDPNSTTLACSLPADHAELGNDCNDTTGTIASITTCSPSPAANTTYSCQASDCIITGCPTNFGDCNEDFSDDCEVDHRTTRIYCGDCDTSCQIACANSSCDDFTEITAGQDFTCGLTASQGRVLCWGDNAYEQVGSDTSGVDVSTPLAVPGLTAVTQVDAGVQHACAAQGGNARCWGRNEYNQASPGSTSEPAPPTTIQEYPTFVPLANVTEVAAGFYFSCARQSTGGIRCWGRNDVGQLGTGNDPATLPVGTSARAVTISGAPITTGIAVTAGWDHACAIVGATANSSEGQVYCWGSDNLGQLGDDATHSTPCSSCADEGQPVVDSTGTPLTDAVAISAARFSTCAIRSSGSVVCWGANFQGQHGNAGTTSGDFFVATSSLTAATAIDGNSSQICAVLGGSAYCWGENDSGQLGDGLEPILKTN